MESLRRLRFLWTVFWAAVCGYWFIYTGTHPLLAIGTSVLACAPWYWPIGYIWRGVLSWAGTVLGVSIQARSLDFFLLFGLGGALVVTVLHFLISPLFRK